MLRFANGKVIEGGATDGASAAYREELRKTVATEKRKGDERRRVSFEEISAAEETQLVAILADAFSLEPTFTAREVFAGGHPDSYLRDTAQTPVEWWDLVDEDGRVRYQLWLYHVDCGALVDAGTSQHAARIVQFTFSPIDPDPALTAAMREALAELVERCPETELAGLLFDEDD